MTTPLTYKDQRLFSINDIISIGGVVAGAVLSALKQKYPLIKMKDLDPSFTGEDTIWSALALENAQKTSFTNNYDPKDYRNGLALKDFGANIVIEVDFVEDTEDENSEGYYILTNTETNEVEDYEDWEAVNRRFTEGKHFVGSWVGRGSPPPSDIIWVDGFDDKE